MTLERLNRLLHVSAEYIVDSSSLRAGVIHDEADRRFIVEIGTSPLEPLEEEEFLGVANTDAGEHKVYIWWRGISAPKSREEMLDSPVFPLYWLFGIIQ